MSLDISNAVRTGTQWAISLYYSIPDNAKAVQAAFHVFGMELLARLDLGATNDFFRTFFRLPTFYWRGFLASRCCPLLYQLSRHPHLHSSLAYFLEYYGLKRKGTDTICNHTPHEG